MQGEVSAGKRENTKCVVSCEFGETKEVMSDSNARQTTESQSIPVVRKVGINGSPMDLSSTPGGSLYATTPGGTRICYDRDFLIKLGESPIAKTPPKNLANFPDGLLKSNNKIRTKKSPKKEKDEEQSQDQFQMEI